MSEMWKPVVGYDLYRAGFGVMAIARYLGLSRGLVPRILENAFGHGE